MTCHNLFVLFPFLVCCFVLSCFARLAGFLLQSFTEKGNIIIIFKVFCMKLGHTRTKSEFNVVRHY